MQYNIKVQLINQSKLKSLFFPVHHFLLHICFRILLTVVAVLSSYSIHLLLKSSGVVGLYGAWILLRSLGSYIHFNFIVPQSCAQDLLVIPSNLSTFTCKASSFVCGSGIRAYEQLGYRAFGTPGKMAAGIAITLQNIGGEVTPRSSVLTPGFFPHWTQESV